jgi:hypothetical protein
MAKNERTSKSVGSIASEILKMKKPIIVSEDLWKNVKKIAASALTQTPDVSPFMKFRLKSLNVGKGTIKSEKFMQIPTL